jgi:hypothetical protein
MALLLTKPLREELLKNNKRSHVGEKIDPFPVVKLIGGSACTWLLTELDHRDLDTAYGLCDLGQGTPQLGYVSLKEIASTKFQFGLPAERDRYFHARHPLSKYVELARGAGRISAI